MIPNPLRDPRDRRLPRVPEPCALVVFGITGDLARKKLLPAVYDNVIGAAEGTFRSLGVPGYVMCHLSHSYHSGACLYFTFGLKPSGERDPAALPLPLHARRSQRRRGGLIGVVGERGRRVCEERG